MNRRQRDQKIQRRLKKKAGQLDGLNKTGMVDQVAAGSSQEPIILTSFYARVRISARQMRINIPQLAALNAGLEDGCQVECSIRRIQ